MTPAQTPVHRRAAFRYPDFRLLFASRYLTIASHQMLLLAVSQFVYLKTHQPIYLGYIGLAIFLPRILFGLLAGYVADRFARRTVLMICRTVQLIAVVALMGHLHAGDDSMAVLFLLLALMGAANAFDAPASTSVVTQIVPPHHFNNAVTWNGMIFQAAMISGPALGGWLYALWDGPVAVLFFVAAMRLISLGLVSAMRIRVAGLDSAAFSWNTVLAGLRYVFAAPVILGTISLDLFAVLLGGAVALMPIFANDILRVGAEGLGWLRAAPAIGAALMAVVLTGLPPIRRAGQAMFICVAIFGMATIVFGISRDFYFSLFCLAVLGAADMVSVVIRGVLVQVETPPAMRGRVSAVNFIFIGASNELGEFESGLTASWFGTVPAVILGGAGTLVIAALWSRQFPELFAYRSRRET